MSSNGKRGAARQPDEPVHKAVNLRDEAKQDLAEHYLFLSESSLDAALRFGIAADQTLALLGGAPGIGEPHRTRKAELAGIRCCSITGFKNHIIYYLIHPNEIEVLRVLHGARGNVDRLLGPGHPEA